MRMHFQDGHDVVGDVTRMAILSKDGRTFVAAIWGTVICREVGTALQLWTKQDAATSVIQSLAFSHDGRWLATGSGFWAHQDGQADARLKDNRVRLWDAAMREAIW